VLYVVQDGLLGIEDMLRADSRTATSSRRAVVARSVLVIGQLAVSVILLVGALLLIRSYQRLEQVDGAFNRITC
jgi:putative ABC transport system permease protein